MKKQKQRDHHPSPNDPTELNNLVADYPELAARLASMHTAWSKNAFKKKKR